MSRAVWGFSGSAGSVGRPLHAWIPTELPCSRHARHRTSGYLPMPLHDAMSFTGGSVISGCRTDVPRIFGAPAPKYLRSTSAHSRHWIIASLRINNRISCPRAPDLWEVQNLPLLKLCQLLRQCDLLEVLCCWGTAAKADSSMPTHMTPRCDA